MKPTSTLALITGLAAAPGMALAFWAWNQHEVLPVSEGVFEVIGEVRSGPSDYWCGAGDYAMRVLRVPVVQRIYTWRGIGPSVNRPGRKAMQFAFAAPEGADTSPSVSLSLTRTGDNMTAALARQYCYGNADPLERWLN